MRSNATAAVVAVVLAAPAWAGPEWEEPLADDAGALPNMAQKVVGDPGVNVEKISGALQGVSPLGGDFQDMYLIYIDAPALFSATVDAVTGFDTQLWLFQADGLGLLANDDAPGMGLLSQLLPTANDGSGATVTTAGFYYLAISGYNSDPESATGLIFDQAISTEISGPDGPGGSMPVSVWPVDGATGAYEINLTGVTFIPCDGDVNMDGIIDFDDLLAVLSTWGPCVGCPADLDMSGFVDFADLLVVLANWGPCPP